MKNKFEINGIVNCPCGGCVITNTGKTFGKIGLKKGTILCWNCKKQYDADKVFNQRQENKMVVYNENKRNN